MVVHASRHREVGSVSHAPVPAAVGRGAASDEGTREEALVVGCGQSVAVGREPEGCIVAAGGHAAHAGPITHILPQTAYLCLCRQRENGEKD